LGLFISSLGENGKEWKKRRKEERFKIPEEKFKQITK
jgi:hypothetical protein